MATGCRLVKDQLGEISDVCANALAHTSICVYGIATREHSGLQGWDFIYIVRPGKHNRHP